MALKWAESLLSVIRSETSMGKLKAFMYMEIIQKLIIFFSPPVSLFQVIIDASVLKLAVSKTRLHLTRNYFWCNTSGREVGLMGILLLASAEWEFYPQVTIKLIL